jgi:hypothetical protein
MSLQWYLVCHPRDTQCLHPKPSTCGYVTCGVILGHGRLVGDTFLSEGGDRVGPIVPGGRIYGDPRCYGVQLLMRWAWARVGCRCSVGFYSWSLS